MAILLQFTFRLAFGLALGMAITPPRWVTSGYYRNHSYVLLGLAVLAAGVIGIQSEAIPLWPAIAAAVLSYGASIAWLYEKPRPGIAALLGVAAMTLCGAWWTQNAAMSPAVQATWSGHSVTGEEATRSHDTTDRSGARSDPTKSTGRHARSPLAEREGDIAGRVLGWLDPLAGGLLLGLTMAAMLLGHWYLNAPGMKLAPLQRLVRLIGAAVLLRAIICGAGFIAWTSQAGMPNQIDAIFLALRWLSGIVGVAAMAWMTWHTLKVPNTQSATGVLYVAVILSFIGELTGQLLASRIGWPV